MAETIQTQTKAKAGKYLTFRLASEEYGVEILKVQEIIGMMNVTRVPRMPDFVRGVINLRGKIIPVIEMRKKFGIPMQADTEKTCIIVVQIQLPNNQLTLGILVDNVSEVLNIAQSQLEPPPTFGTEIDTAFLLGMGKIGNKVVILLDIDKVLTGTETHELLAKTDQVKTQPEKQA